MQQHGCQRRRPAGCCLPSQPTRHPARALQEPEFFSDTCGFQPHACSLPDQEFYLHSTLRLGEVLAANLTAAGAEASTHYGRNGQLLARGIYEVRRCSAALGSPGSC